VEEVHYDARMLALYQAEIRLIPQGLAIRSSEPAECPAQALAQLDLPAPVAQSLVHYLQFCRLSKCPVLANIVQKLIIRILTVPFLFERSPEYHRA
jgi:hypothetical protein